MDPWEALDIPFKPSREAFESWLDSEVELFFRVVRSGERAGHCAESPDGQHQLQMDTEECRYCHKWWTGELGYSPNRTSRPYMMDSRAQSCSSSPDGFHWVKEGQTCRLCGSSCAPLPKFVVTAEIADELNALAAAIMKARG